MKFKLFISSIFICTSVSLNAQWSGTNPLWTNSNVGIGTTTPGSNLHVQATAGSSELVRFVNSDFATGIGSGIKIYTGATTNDTYTMIQALDQGGSSSNSLILNPSGGYIGIGTTSPTTALSFGGASDRIIQLEAQTTDVAGKFLMIRAGSTVSGTYVSNVAGGSLYLRSGAGTGTGESTIRFATGTPTTGTTIQSVTTKMVILGNGNVGINTITPEAKFHIYDPSYWQTDGPPSAVITSIRPALSLYDRTTSTDGGAVRTIYNDAGKLMFVRAAYTSDYGWDEKITDLTIDSYGKVGIGTTNPQKELDVNGTIRAKEIITTLDGWSDYVFDKDYKLMPLSEVEDYIARNNKLPEVPSATEVINDGVKLGEMNALLLKKVEELTLYVIGQNTLNEQQNKEIESLRQELRVLKGMNKIE